MGAIVELPSGSYRQQVQVAGRRHSVTGENKQEVRRKVRELLHNADKGILPPAEQITLDKYLERWLADAVKHSTRPRTFESYSALAAWYIVPVLGRHKLTALQPGHVQKLYADLLEHGRRSGGGPLSTKTVRNVHGCLHTALEQAVKWGLVPRNVAGVVDPPRVRRKEIQALDAVQVRTLLATAHGTRWEALLTLAIATGMRQGELLGLKWGDVDLDARALHVRRQLGRDGTLAEPKTSKARRKVELPSYAVTALREHRARQNELRLKWGPEWEDRGLVFCTLAGYRGKKAEPGSGTRPGGALQARNVVREFKVLLGRAELPDVPFHALRHTAATLLLQKGVHPKIVQERLGHSNIAMTLDTYSHVMPSMDRGAADLLDELLG